MMIYFLKKILKKNYDFQNDGLILGNIISNQGAYGEVSLCTFENIPGTFVIKEFKINYNDSSKSEEENARIRNVIKDSFFYEEKILNKVKNHDNIVLLHGSRKFDNSLSLIFQYYNQSLKDILVDTKSFKKLDLKQKINICYQLCKGFNYLHSKLIVHLDIKVNQIFFLSIFI